jgi:hypothetical protein
MANKTVEQGPLNWQLPVYALLGTLIVFLALAISQPTSTLYIFIVVPVISILLMVVAVWSAIVRKRRRTLAVLAMLAVHWVISVPLVMNYSAVRDSTRWLVWSRDYKAKVLAQPPSPNGDLQHIDWDGWGWGGENTEVFLVFDPADSLSAAAASRQPGRFSGIPCKVNLVRRLESHWYAAQFYTGEVWGQCNSGDASGR